MNKLLKILIAILGGINTIFSICIPIFVALLIINLISLTGINQLILIIVGLGSMLYRAISNVLPLIE